MPVIFLDPVPSRPEYLHVLHSTQRRNVWACAALPWSTFNKEHTVAERQAGVTEHKQLRKIDICSQVPMIKKRKEKDNYKFLKKHKQTHTPLSNESMKRTTNTSSSTIMEASFCFMWLASEKQKGFRTVSHTWQLAQTLLVVSLSVQESTPANCRFQLFLTYIPSC